MDPLFWIILGGLLMSAIAMVGSVTLVLEPATLDRLIMPLVAFAAGSLIGGAFFHMIPAALDAGLSPLTMGALVAAGFSAFFLLEQVLHWHHCHRARTDCRTRSLRSSETSACSFTAAGRNGGHSSSTCCPD